MTGLDLWQTKVAAYCHDPAEKALVLLRDPAGHEGRTVATLRESLFGGPLPGGIAEAVAAADRWAAAADRPQFPVGSWARVVFAEEPVLVHPLSGTEYDLKRLAEVQPAAVAEASTAAFASLVVRQEGAVDWKRTFLRMWRCAPDTAPPGFGELWRLLPADTRVPDHTIWEHLRLCSAFAGAFAAGWPALLTVSIGPVQSFIAQARSTSDLWSGSHLLSRLSWEAMKVICDRLGPDAVVLPDLHGVPMVDLWLREQGVECGERIEARASEHPRSDAHPAFTASLPNRFLAIVPDSMVEPLAEAITEAVRAWALEAAQRAWGKVVEGASSDFTLRQIESQLEGFPEVAWAAVPWALVQEPGAGPAATALDTRPLERLLSSLQASDPAKAGFLASPAWKILQREGPPLDGVRFWSPNAGFLYPALSDAADRLGASAKASRTFQQLVQQGYRCSLCGEREWIATQEAERGSPPGTAGSAWESLGRRRPSLARKGERLCAICGLKRMWPDLFVDELAVDGAGPHTKIRRYVVSTHTMALAPLLESLAERDGVEDTLAWLDQLEEKYGTEPCAVPVRLLRALSEGDRRAQGEPLRSDVIKRIPSLLDALRQGNAGDDPEARSAVLIREIEGRLADAVAAARPESYYAIVLMDGDRMGAWLSGTTTERPTFEGLWHPAVRRGAASQTAASKQLAEYMKSHRVVSPSFHAAISRALNGFSGTLARFVFEEIGLGKLIYSGGDDVLGLVCVRDLLDVILCLRCTYSGVTPGGHALGIEAQERWRDAGLELRGGHALLSRRKREGKLVRVMGEKATSSIGAVVAHHMAPLGAVLREVRKAEQRAKHDGGRDAFSIGLVKRSGGAIHLTAKWGLSRDADGNQVPPTPLVMAELVAALRNDLSRRAVFHIVSWLRDAPIAADHAGRGLEEGARELLRAGLSHQLQRQWLSGAGAGDPVAADPARSPRGLAAALVAAVDREVTLRRNLEPAAFLESLLQVCEFLARPARGEG